MSRAVVLPLQTIAILVGSAFLAGYLLGGSAKRAPRGDSSATPQRAFVLLVNLKFTAPAHRDTFLAWIAPVCEDVRAREAETTLSYRIAVSDKDPLSVLVLERYSDKEHGYMRVHKSGSEFLKFREKLKDMQERGDVTIEGESYLESELGYV